METVFLTAYSVSNEKKFTIYKDLGMTKRQSLFLNKKKVESRNFLKILSQPLFQYDSSIQPCRQYIVDEIQYEEDRKWHPNIFIWILHE